MQAAAGALMALNRRSRNITQGVQRAPNRSMYYGMGYESADFDKPMVGVANAHSTITPCNAGLQPLADAAVDGLREAGANPQVFGTPTISDGMSMGTEGMKYSLVSREVIADCIETCVGGQWMDGVLVIGGCDKNMPGGMMGMLRANVPSILFTAARFSPGASTVATSTSSASSRRSASTAPGRFPTTTCWPSSGMRSPATVPAVACTPRTR
jgi:dihydroxy-acid dehydratase